MKLELHNIQIGTIKTMADGSIKMDIYTRELSPEQMVQVFALRKHEGEFDLSAVYDGEAESKTKSARLRAVVYKAWEMNTDRSKTFELYYNEQMEKIINHYKDKL